MRLSFLASAVSLGSLVQPALAQEAPKPHLAIDIETGDVAHAATHFVADPVVETFSNGRPARSDVAGMVARFENCRFVRFGLSPFLYRNVEQFIFNCGDSYDMAINTGGKTDAIERALYYAEATAPPPPLPRPRAN